jgi:hypothetical protein
MKTLLALAVLLIAAAAQAEEFRMPPLQNFSETVDRPLFAPDRRPHQSPPQIQGPAAPIALTGIVIQDRTRYALINEGALAPRRIAEGERLAAGTVTQILPDRIVVAAPGGRDTVVKLFDKKPAAAASTPATVAPSRGPPGRIVGN